jgi:hypothetical protein
MLHRTFALLRTSPGLANQYEFPLSLSECPRSPLAGAFDAASHRHMAQRLALFPFAVRSPDKAKAWLIRTPQGDALEVWLTSDGQVWLSGRTRLNLVFAVYMQLVEACLDVVLEDSITGQLHNRSSFLALVRRDEGRRHAETGPEVTPPLAA